jgi:hypothetical protein
MKKPAFQLSSRGEALLRIAILVLIALLAGPEIFAAIEMQILLELLGAALFTAAFIAGARLALSQAADLVVSLLLPIPHVAVLRGQARLRAKGVAAIYILKNAVWSMGFVLICWQLTKEIARLLY